MSLPEIPEEAILAIYDLDKHRVTKYAAAADVVEAAWPHLYAAALQHAARDLDDVSMHAAAHLLREAALAVAAPRT